MKLFLVFLLLLTIIVETAQQMFFKFAGKYPARHLLFNFLGILMYLLFIAIWFRVLKELPLGIALPIMGMNYVAVALAGKWFFQEKITRQRWCGILLIILGLLAVWRGGGDFL